MLRRAEEVGFTIGYVILLAGGIAAAIGLWCLFGAIGALLALL